VLFDNNFTKAWVKVSQRRQLQRKCCARIIEQNCSKERKTNGTYNCPYNYTAYKKLVHMHATTRYICDTTTLTTALNYSHINYN